MGSRIPQERGSFEGDIRHMCRPIVVYLRTNALRPPRANVPAPQTQRTIAFSAARGDNTAMRPLAMFIWTFVICRLCKMSHN